MTNFKCYLLSEPHKPTIAPAVPKENKRWDGFSPTNVVGGLDSFSVNNLNQYTVVNGNVPNYGGDAILPALPHNIRVRGFNRNPLGRRSRRGRVRSFITPSSRRCGYKTVAGRSAWLNRDPIQEFGGINLYKFVHNHPNVQIDSFGLCECEKENPAKDLFKNAADNLAAALGGKGGKIVRLLLLAADAKKGCGDMNAAAGACGDFAKQEAADPGYASGQFDCETCCHGIMDSFPGLGGFSYFQCHAMCAKF